MITILLHLLDGKVNHLFPADTRFGQICSIATELFYEKGYHATSMRDIAKGMGMQVASLYNHVDSKQDLLFHIMQVSMDALAQQVERSLPRDCTSSQRLRAAMLSHILFHGQYPTEALVTDRELRALEPENRTSMIALRDRYENLWREMLREGAGTGEFKVNHPALITIAILTLCTGVIFWYNPKGPYPLKRVADIYADFVISGLQSGRMVFPTDQFPTQE